MEAHFYILSSESSDKFYIGHTTEPLDERVRKHNSDHKGFTGKYQDWTLAYNEKYPTKEQAYRRERQVKRWKSRKMIEKLLAAAAQPNP